MEIGSWKYWFSCGLVFCVMWTTAGRSQPESHSKKLKDGIVVQFDSTILRLQVCDDRIIRVLCYPEKIISLGPSLVVNRSWSKVKWIFEESAHTFVVSTGRMTVRVDKGTSAVSFLDEHGEIFLQENPDSPRRFDSATVSGERVVHVSERFVLSPDEGIYGLGQQQAGVMNHRNHRVTLIQNNKHIAIPFLVSTRNYGLLWDNYSHTEFKDSADGMSLWSEVAGVIDYYVIYGSSIDDVVSGYREATGQVPMFPKWAFGYWQSKERYKTRQELLAVAREYRERKIPIDNVVQDWQYWGRLGWNAMAFDDSTYPQPREMIDSLHKTYKMHLMISVWPQVGPGTPLYKELEPKGFLYPTPIWNGGKTYDAYSSEARDLYWKYLNNGLFSLGVDAWWMDATEPEWKYCEDILDAKTGIVKNGKNALGSSSEYLNTYPLITTGGVYEHQRATTNDKRVFILTRSAFAGQQRNATAVWSGDIVADWKVFRNQISGGINCSMSSIPYWNSDIGAFFPGSANGGYPAGVQDEAYRELYVRWFQFGAFCPIFRSHGTGTPKEIWQFGEPDTWAYDALVKFDNLRYRLLPYIYSVAWMVTNDGYTMMRGLPMDFVTDKNVLDIDNQYMFGPALMVMPVTQPQFHAHDTTEIIPKENLLPAEGEGNGLTARYYKDRKLEKEYAKFQTGELNFHSDDGTMPEGTDVNNFSARWNGFVLSKAAGNYKFWLLTDDITEVWFDGKLVIEQKAGESKDLFSFSVELDANKKYPIRIEYVNLNWGIQKRLYWWTPGMTTTEEILARNKTVNMYLPQTAGWYDFWTGEMLKGGENVALETPIDIMPIQVKAGSIVPLGPFKQYAVEKAEDPIELRIYRGADGAFNLYEDENDNYNYEHGGYSLIPIRWDEKPQVLTIGQRKGKFPGMMKIRRFQIVLVDRIHGTGVDPPLSPQKVVTYDGEEVRVSFSSIR